MFFTKATVSLAFFLSYLASALPAAAPAEYFPILPRVANQSARNVSPAHGSQKYIAKALCTPEQLVNESKAWDDARLYAEALASWIPNGSYQPAMDLYMGTDSVGPLREVLQGMPSNMKMLLDPQPLAVSIAS